MSAEFPTPKRRFVLSINISGDTFADVLRELRELTPHVEEHGPACSSSSGGGPSSHWVDIVEDPTMTPERYQAEVEEWCRAYDERKTAATK